ncbi:hypothetical protein ABEB36_010519 [Hypothenemus hampei]|uniref:FHA domain-containing protein n=1 Tax=Hypothenemus hampei TaxID=57062 RepID=A0ABD1EJZ7_HYPHA
MVVVSGTRVKNVVPCYSPQNNQTIMADLDNMVPKAVLISRPNSHPFLDRTLILEHPVKVGRAVPHAKPSSTNAIFDCKVLSRHHALISYENGKFFLQDTKSSNGTFVNNNRLSPGNHEVSSGDIVQFGVDVVENNRKVTHGCIIATLKLYLPDGKEAKASPSITKCETHGVIPLDEIYELNQILQQANQREQCLESKLSALQTIVDETKRSAEESWQIYVGEERLLSRLSALETQLQQARNNWSDERLKEEITKLRENNERYQEAAKEALEKVHSEKQQAVVLALEQERAKVVAEQDAELARELLIQAQMELTEMDKKLIEIQTKANEDKQDYEKHIRELEQHMEAEEAKIIELEKKIYELSLEVAKKHSLENKSDKPELIVTDDLKLKEEIIAENEIMTEMNKSNFNGFKENHISLTVAPVEQEACEDEKTEDQERETVVKDDSEKNESENKEKPKKVTFDMAATEEINNEEDSELGTEPASSDFSTDNVDSKTLKYQYQSAQREEMELRRKLEVLEKNSEANRTKIIELTKSLDDERTISGERLEICERLREELAHLEEKWHEGHIENQKLLERINEFQYTEVEPKESESKNEETLKHIESSLSSAATTVTNEQLMIIEEELVIFKEKYSQICDEKMKLQKDLLRLRVQYDMVCNNMYNKYFLYVGPLVMIVFYLLMREWFS